MTLMGPELARDPLLFMNIFVDSNGSRACKGPFIVYKYISFIPGQRRVPQLVIYKYECIY